mgnify:CR=1 FL=1
MYIPRLKDLREDHDLAQKQVAALLGIDQRVYSNYELGKRALPLRHLAAGNKLRKHMAIKSLSIRIDTEMLDKLHVVADYEGRSANSQINILIRDCVAAYEKEHGEISLGKKQK